MADPWIYLAIRLQVDDWKYVEIHAEDMLCREVTVGEYLMFKERIVEHRGGDDPWVVEVDLRPFERGFPKLIERRSIGRGVEHLSRHASARAIPGRCMRRSCSACPGFTASGNTSSNIEREETRRYLEMFFVLMYRPFAREQVSGK